MLCQLLFCLISSEEKLIAAKKDFIENNENCSPVIYFQRIDRAGKGHLTQADFLQFLSENGFSEQMVLEIGLAVP